MLKEGTISQKSVEEEGDLEVSKHRRSDLNGRFFVEIALQLIRTSGVVIQDLVTLLKILIIHLHLFYLTALEKVCVKPHVSEEV